MLNTQKKQKCGTPCAKKYMHFYCVICSLAHHPLRMCTHVCKQTLMCNVQISYGTRTCGAM